jgi:meso-butanediol dehydrogenase / (S,S)-butanediol dehydrogenase / diacetyl reductase
MTQRLSQKVAVVTGAGAGLGRAVAERFALEGSRVVIAEVDEKRGRETLDRIESLGADAVLVKTDVAEEADAIALADEVRKRYGHVDIMYNNAGILFHGKDAKAHELSLEIWDRTMRVNLRGFWLCTKYLLPLMLENGGAIIHVGSPTALNGCGAGLTAYCASKGGILGLTKVMAIDYAPNRIRVNCIIPGVMDTPMNEVFLVDKEVGAKQIARIPLGRLGVAEDVAGLAVFLASEDSQYCTGGLYMADGGLMAF